MRKGTRARKACAVLGAALLAGGAASCTSAGTQAARPPATPPAKLMSRATGVLIGVSCPSPVACVAVGYYSAAVTGNAPPTSQTSLPLAESWDGKSWTGETPPGPATPGNAADGSLTAVSCATAGVCMAIGYYTSGTSRLPLAERRTGGRWAAQPLTAPAGAGGSNLSAVSCAASSTCMAVGYYTKTKGANPSPNQPGTIPMAESWDGAGWNAQALPGQSGAAGSYLSGISCTSGAASTCMAVGGSLYAVTSAKESVQALAEWWNGSGWTVKHLPRPADSTNTILNAISCASARFCLAVGYTTAGLRGMPLVEAWDGKNWSIMPSPAPPGTLSIGFANLSCTFALACMAVGDDTTRTSTLAAAASWQGLGWAIGFPLSPAGAKTTSLTDVSCTSARSCMAVGSSTPSSTVALAESWDGQTWAIQPVRLPKA